MNLLEEPIILNFENDFLGSREKAEAIKEFIEKNDELIQKNNMIAIYGEWGSGKSSLMKTIDCKLEVEKYDKIWIDMWKEESDYSNLSIKILNKILEKIKLDSETKKSLIKAFLTLGKGINVNMPFITYNMEKAFEQLENEIEPLNNIDNFINDFKTKIEKYIEKNNKKIIVFLDDLDRCNSENMLNIIYNIKLLLAIKDIVFIFGIDKEAVALALKNKYNNEINKAENFLDKLFPISFNMPKNTFDFQKLINNTFKELEQEKIKIIEEFFIKINFMNPRRIKKVLLRYYIIKNMLIEKGLLNEDNEWNIIWILFFIIENEFEEKNYCYMLKNNKKDIFSSKVSFEKGNSTIRRIPGYNEYKISLYVEEEEKSRYEQMELIEYILNPDDLVKDTMKIFGIESEIGLVLNLNLWLDLFKDSISKRFCKFFFKNRKNCITMMGKNINDFFNIRNLIMQELDKLM